MGPRQRGNGMGLVLWTYDLTPQTFEAIRDRRPQYIVTGQVRLMREWLEYE